MRGVAAGLAVLLLTGCASAGYFPPSLFETMERCGPGSEPSEIPVMDDGKSAWYSSFLRAAGEPRLGEIRTTHRVGEISALRFTLLRTFHSPVIVRIEATVDGGLLLTATELSGTVGYDPPGAITRRVERPLSPGEVAQLSVLIAASRVLDLPPTDDCTDTAPGEVVIRGDGSRWIVEANGPQGYRFVDRWSPSGGPVRELGQHLMRLTGWSPSRVY